MAKKIGVLCEQFFKMDNPNECLFGGGERWLFDFVSLLKKMGYYVETYQFSNKQWTQKYKTMTVKGLGNMSGVPMNMSKDYECGMNKFNELTSNFDGVFYLSMNLCFNPPKDKPVLTVSHGLMFDGAMPEQKQNSIQNLDNFKRWIRNSTKTISVDTNTIKVMQTYDHRIANKFEFVVNYADLEMFKPNEKLNDDKFVVLFSRRLQYCRGYQTMMKAVDVLREKYEDMHFLFCGKGNEGEEKHFTDWYNQNSKNVERTWVEMKDMPKIYQKATISCVPTIYAEGSSLSAIESIASGVPIIATCVGGLTDICIENFNGKLIMPDDSNSYKENDANANSLIEAIEYMYHNREHLKQMRENGIAMSKAYSKEIWESKISKILIDLYGEPK